MTFFLLSQDRVVEVVEATLQGQSVQAMESVSKAGSPLSLMKIRKNPLIEIIPINSGCLNQCTYCKTKHARGELRSYPIEEIVARVKQVLTEGVVEIWMTSEDLGTYGRDIGSSLPLLLDAVLPLLPEGTMLRMGMTNPPYILEHVKELCEALKHPRVYSFIHIPVQAGSDAVLTVSHIFLRLHIFLMFFPYFPCVISCYSIGYASSIHLS
jgi:threonylcarbamoyladenosine tRNA methylthiotransferase CDKAL1